MPGQELPPSTFSDVTGDALISSSNETTSDEQVQLVSPSGEPTVMQSFSKMGCLSQPLRQVDAAGAGTPPPTFPVLESLRQAVLLGFATFLLEAVRPASLGLSRCDSAHCTRQDTQASLLPAARKCAEHTEENPGTFLVEKAKFHLWARHTEEASTALCA